MPQKCRFLFCGYVLYYSSIFARSVQCRACGTMQGTSPNRIQRMKRCMWPEEGNRKSSTRDYDNKTRRLAHSSLSVLIAILSQDGFGITKVRSGNLGASLGSLFPLISSAKKHSQTGPPGPRMWHVQSDTWTSQWCKVCHTSLSQRAAVPHRPSTISSFRN